MVSEQGREERAAPGGPAHSLHLEKVAKTKAENERPPYVSYIQRLAQQELAARVSSGNSEAGPVKAWAQPDTSREARGDHWMLRGLFPLLRERPGIKLGAFNMPRSLRLGPEPEP